MGLVRGLDFLINRNGHWRILVMKHENTTCEEDTGLLKDGSKPKLTIDMHVII